MEGRKIIQVEDKVPLKLLVPLSIQHMFAMFGASVLVPFMFGISPAIVLFMNGVGTLLFMMIQCSLIPTHRWTEAGKGLREPGSGISWCGFSRTWKERMYWIWDADTAGTVNMRRKMGPGQ